MKNIKATPKKTSATTIYHDIDPADEKYIYDWMIRFMSEMNEESTHNAAIREEWFKQRPKEYIKGKRGINSHASAIGGLVAAKIENPRKNLSSPQLKIVENLFVLIADYYSNLSNAPEEVVFV